MILFLATSVDVERVFSKGRILLLHLHNRMSPQTTHALMFLNAWSLHRYIKDQDIVAVLKGDEMEGDDDVEFEEGWDDIGKL